MVERICPACRHANPLENRFCGACGAGLEPDALALRSEGTISIAGQQLPVAQIKQVGQAVAMGLVAVAAEAGLAWLRNRAQRAGLPTVVPTPAPERTALAPRPAEPITQVVTVVSQRVVEVWEQGRLARQVVEKHVWRKES